MMSRHENTPPGVPEVLADLKRDLTELSQTALITSTSGGSGVVTSTVNETIQSLKTALHALEEKQLKTEERLATLEAQMLKMQRQQSHPALAKLSPVVAQPNSDYRRSSSAAKIKNTMRAVGFLSQSQNTRPTRFAELVAPPTIKVPSNPAYPGHILEHTNFTENSIAHSAPASSSFQDRVSAIRALVLSNKDLGPEDSKD